MKKAWLEAQKNLVGGVDSPVRAFRAVGGMPIFMKQGRGATLYDMNGAGYIDFCLSWGAILFGHAEGQTVKAIQRQASLGTSFGTVTEYETALAKEIKKAFPGMERIRFTSSGTEAVMSAIRLARGVTHRNRIVKFEGGYHGHADSLLVGPPSSRGIPPPLAELTTVLEYNNTEEARRFLRTRRDVACVIVEPIAGNMGVIPARQDFLQVIRKETARQGALLIFDEVISGFRVAYGGAQHLYGIEPDITTLGKVIGGGLPVGAFGGKRRWMDELSPNGKVYQAGTLSGNPLAMAAGLSVLKRLSKDFYKALNQKSAAFFQEARSVLKKQAGGVVINAAGSMFTIFFAKKAPLNFRGIPASHHKKFKTFFHQMLKYHVYLPPSGFESCFISRAHGRKELEITLKALRTCSKTLFLLLLCFTLTGADYLGHTKLQRSKNFMGTTFELMVFDSTLTKERLAFVADNAFHRIGTLYDKMSNQTEDSIISKINRAKAGDSFKLEEDAFYVLKESLRVQQAVGEGFDMTDWPLKKAWLEAKEKGEPPSKQAIDALLPNVGTQWIHLDSETKTLTVKKEGAQLDVDEIIRGYAIERALQTLQENGVKSALISAGGSLKFLGLSPDGRSWRLGIDHPRKIDDYAATLELEEETAVSTTADYENFFLFKGKRYPIVIDPKTGFPPENHVTGVTVVAENAALANILSKAFFLLGPDKSFEIADRLKDEKVQALFIEEKSDGQLTISCSEGIQTRLMDIDL